MKKMVLNYKLYLNRVIMNVTSWSIHPQGFLLIVVNDDRQIGINIKELASWEYIDENEMPIIGGYVE